MQVLETEQTKEKQLSQFTNSINLYTANKVKQLNLINIQIHFHNFILKIDNILNEPISQ